jgi:acyl-CoA dehydrogenase
MSNTFFADLPLSREEREFLEITRQVCAESILPVRSALDESGDFPQGVLDRFRSAGIFKAVSPVEFDGFGFHKIMPVLVTEVIAEYCIAIGSIFGISAILAPLPIRLGGTEDQKRRYLPKLASGEWLGAFAMTESNAGSDIASLTTSAVKKSDRYILNGKKKWISNAGRADVYFIFAKTDKDKDPRAAISCFIVEKDTPGLSFGKLENKLGLRCVPNSPIFLDEVEVPEENLIGLRPGNGLLLAIQSLTRSRVSVGALGVGLATAAYKEALKYVRERRQFDKRVLDFQVVQHMLTDMLVKIETARLLTYKAGWYAYVLNHPDAPKFSAMAKYHSSEIAMQVATDALQLHGGSGFVKDSPVEKMFRDAKILSIYEGTSQLLKNQIASSIVQEAGKYK